MGWHSVSPSFRGARSANPESEFRVRSQARAPRNDIFDRVALKVCMTHPGEQFYPQGVHWSDPIARGTLPDLSRAAAAEFGARPAIEFRDRPISFGELETMVETAASAFLRAGYGKDNSVALFLGNSPDHPVNFFGALKAGARIVHLSPLDGEIALSHKLVRFRRARCSSPAICRRCFRPR